MVDIIIIIISIMVDYLILSCWNRSPCYLMRLVKLAYSIDMFSCTTQIAMEG